MNQSSVAIFRSLSLLTLIRGTDSKDTWRFLQARQCLAVRGLYPILADLSEVIIIIIIII